MLGSFYFWRHNMSTKYKAEVFHYIDLLDSNENHVSISGGKATHFFNFLTDYTDSDLDSLVESIKRDYGEPMDINNEESSRLDFAISESHWAENNCPEHYTIYFSEVKKEPIDITKYFNQE